MSEGPLPKALLVGLDGSDASLRAAEYAVRLAQALGGRLLGLHVILLPEHLSPSVSERLRKEGQERVEPAFRRVRAQAEDEGVEVETKVTTHPRSVVQALVAEAEGWGADLIVVGTQGTGGIPRMVLGSVAAGVVALASCPVLAVR